MELLLVGAEGTRGRDPSLAMDARQLSAENLGLSDKHAALVKAKALAANERVSVRTTTKREVAPRNAAIAR